MAQMDFENRNAQHRNSIGQGHRGMGPTPGIQEDKVWQVHIRSRRWQGYPFLNFLDKFAFVIGLKIIQAVQRVLQANLIQDLVHGLGPVDVRLTYPQKVEVGTVQNPCVDYLHRFKGRR